MATTLSQRIVRKLEAMFDVRLDDRQCAAIAAIVYPPQPQSPPPSAPQPTPQPTPQPAPQPQSSSRIPAAICASLQTLLGLTADQCDTVLQLICLPENGECKWWNHYDYIEFLKDGRGYTCTLFGACSGTQDLCWIFDELHRLNPRHPLLKYYESMKEAKGDKVTGLKGLEKDLPLHNDEEWKRAVWKVYIDLYWSFVSRFVSKTGDCGSRPGPLIVTPLGKGFVLDAAINHGADLPSFKHIFKGMQNPDDARDETAWLEDFMNARMKLLKSGFQHLDTSKTGDRCRLWLDLLKSGNASLARPIVAYPGYWGKHQIS